MPAGERALSRAGARGLDWFSFFLADIQTGFGPFVAIYLTAHQWAQFDIGLVLTAGGLVAVAGQMPGGALVDAVRSARLLAGLAVSAICLSALPLPSGLCSRWSWVCAWSKPRQVACWGQSSLRSALVSLATPPWVPAWGAMLASPPSAMALRLPPWDCVTISFQIKPYSFSPRC